MDCFNARVKDSVLQKILHPISIPSACEGSYYTQGE